MIERAPTSRGLPSPVRLSDRERSLLTELLRQEAAAGRPVPAHPFRMDLPSRDDRETLDDLRSRELVESAGAGYRVPLRSVLALSENPIASSWIADADRALKALAVMYREDGSLHRSAEDVHTAAGFASMTAVTRAMSLVGDMGLLGSLVPDDAGYVSKFTLVERVIDTRSVAAEISAGGLYKDDYDQAGGTAEPLPALAVSAVPSRSAERGVHQGDDSAQRVETRDVFLCHASDDKETFVRPLADELERLGMSVWLDETELVIGDSLSHSIDDGLARSRFGVVVLSRAFFGKSWPERELAGLVTREMIDGTKLILPIWYGVDEREVARYSAPLAGRLAAIVAGHSVREVAAKVLRAVRRRGPPSGPSAVSNAIAGGASLPPGSIVDISGLMFRGAVEEIDGAEWVCRLDTALGEHSLHLLDVAARLERLAHHYVAVSHPGVGRELLGPPRLQRDGARLVARLAVLAERGRTSAHAIPADIDLSRLGAAARGRTPGGVADIGHCVQRVLSTARGEIVMAEGLGSLVAEYAHRHEYALLSELIAVETARLAFVPLTADQTVALPFIRHVESVAIPDVPPTSDWLPTNFSLDVEGVGRWRGEVQLYVPREAAASNAPYSGIPCPRCKRPSMGAGRYVNVCGHCGLTTGEE